jgi:hypothetical protein
MATTQNKSIPAEPLGVGGIVAEMALKEEIGDRGQCHSCSWVTVAYLLYSVGCQGARINDRLVIIFGEIELF